MSNNEIKNIDFNCNLADLSIENDLEKSFEILEYMSSVNIACGIQAGNPLLIKRAIEHCKFKNKVIGALIGLPENITTPQTLTEEDIEAIVLYQLGALSSFAKAYSLNIEQVRPDGNMYRFASENLDFSVNVAKAVKKYSKWFTLLGASGEILDKTAQELNINVAHEICIEKQYTNSAINYDMANISDSDTVIERIKNLIKTSEINNTDGTKSIVKVDTVHFSIDLSVETVKESANIIVPRPVNFNKAVVSGWVE